MVQIANTQANQMQALGHFHGYPLDFSQPLDGCRSFSWAIKQNY